MALTSPSIMDIRIDSLIEGAHHAQGTVVVIDVLRAYTTASVAFSKGVERIILVAEPEEALKLRGQGAGDLCMGEVGGKKPSGFDFGNSPHELSQVADADLCGKTIIQSTRAGTVGACAVPAGAPMFAASFVIAEATCEAIRQAGSKQVTILAMGSAGLVRGDEDELCALYLRNRLQGRQPDVEATMSLARCSHEAAPYGSPEMPFKPVADLEIAMQIDTFDFAIRVVDEEGLLVARRHSVGGSSAK
jgi:2-phosphosulfolactate phosphatase